MKKSLIAFAVIFAAIFMSSCNQPSSLGSSLSPLTTLVAEPGDIVLADGSVIKPVSLTKAATDYTKYKPIAVVIRKQEALKPALCIGLEPAQNKWCSSGFKGYANIEAIYSSNVTNGVDAFLKLAEATDGEALYNLGSYAAWEYCLKYKGTDETVAESFRSGWYLPTEEEISLTNNEAVKRTLVMLTGVPADTSAQYWTAKQHGAQPQFAVTYKIWKDEKAYSDKKTTTVYALPVHVLSSVRTPVAAPKILPTRTDIYNTPEEEQYLTISTETEGAFIYYGLDNNSSRFRLYTAPVKFDTTVNNARVGAIAYKNGIFSLPVRPGTDYETKKIN